MRPTPGSSALADEPIPFRPFTTLNTSFNPDNFQQEGNANEPNKPRLRTSHAILALNEENTRFFGCMTVGTKDADSKPHKRVEAYFITECSGPQDNAYCGFALRFQRTTTSLETYNDLSPGWITVDFKFYGPSHELSYRLVTEEEQNKLRLATSIPHGANIFAIKFTLVGGAVLQLI